ncbi:hypothetical protein NEPAR06_2175, partial [Nematocida parisii]
MNRYFKYKMGISLVLLCAYTNAAGIGAPPAGGAGPGGGAGPAPPGAP